MAETRTIEIAPDIGAAISQVPQALMWGERSRARWRETPDRRFV